VKISKPDFQNPDGKVERLDMFFQSTGLTSLFIINMVLTFFTQGYVFLTYSWWEEASELPVKSVKDRKVFLRYIKRLPIAHKTFMIWALFSFLLSVFYVSLSNVPSSVYFIKPDFFPLIALFIIEAYLFEQVKEYVKCYRLFASA